MQNIKIIILILALLCSMQNKPSSIQLSYKGNSIFKKNIVSVTSPPTMTLKNANFTAPVYGRISSPFGRRNRCRHTGIDIAVVRGTAIHAAQDGIVIYAQRMGQYGKFVVIRHSKHVVTRYAHCSRLLVKVGAHVLQGHVIAKVGSTGKSTGAHLHFEIKYKGQFVNPALYIDFAQNVISSNGLSSTKLSGKGCQSACNSF